MGRSPSGHLFSGYVFATDHGEVQADHLLICEAGVFVIECKSFVGSIQGSRNGPWHQVIRGRHRTISASWGANPADQVIRGIHAVRAILSRNGPPPFVSGVVLFPKRAKLSLANVPVNAFAGNAPSAFTLDALVAYLNGPEKRPVARSDVLTGAGLRRLVLRHLIGAAPALTSATRR